MNLDELSAELHAIRDRLRWAQSESQADCDRVAPQHRGSAENLVHYVALRQHDLTDLQDELASVALTSFTRFDADVLEGVDNTIETLDALREQRERAAPTPVPMPGTQLLRRRRSALLGPRTPTRTTRIMVTLPSEASTDPDLIRRFRSAGMDLARINLAHDDDAAWSCMAREARASGALVAMDLAGPKVRTGPLEPGPKVTKIKPSRDASGRVTQRAAVLLVDAHAGAPADASGAHAFLSSLPIAGIVPVRDFAAATLAPGDELRMRDARGSRRRLEVLAATDSYAIVAHDRTVYYRTGDRIRTVGDTELEIGELPPADAFHVVSVGDEIVLTRSLDPAPATSSSSHRIGCTLAAVIDDAAVGDRVFFDDGKIEGRVVDKTDDALRTEVLRARPGGVKLRAEKGINVPDTDLRVPALTQDDLDALPVAAANADFVNLSFVRSPDDVFTLIDRLRELGAENVGIVLKIETKRAYRALPQLLLAAMHWDRVGVMIARGDLAVELGFEELAEVQEEMLRLCEAAHVPVIWATQVLDTLARTGIPSRAEVTDAAMGRRAEAVMLNKGPFVEQAIGALVEILERMTDVMSKQRLHLPALPHWNLDPVEGSAFSTGLGSARTRDELLP